MKSNFFKMPEKVFGISSSLIKIFFLPIGVIVVFILSLGSIIIPKFKSIKGLNTSIKTVKSQIKSTEEKKNYLLSIDQEELINNENYLSSAVLQEKNSYLLVGVIRNISDKYNFQIKSFSISPVKIKEGSENDSLKVAEKNVAVKIPINVILSGPDEKSLDLIKAIENSLPILFIDKFNKKTNMDIAELDLVISSYYIADKTDLISGDLTLTDLMPTKEETDLLTKITKFDKNDNMTKILIDQKGEEKSFIEYKRENPFTL